MDGFPLHFVAPLVDIENEATRAVPSVTLDGHGKISRIKVQESPLSHVLRKDHVEVEVEYCGMNFTDNYLRLGIIRNTRFPVVMGSECCGVVTRVGQAVTDLKAGQRVLCLKMLGGLFRHVVHVPRKNCFLVPDGITARDAIGLGINYLVAHVCLFELGSVKPDDVVFMQSIAGGVGTALTQLSKTVQNVTVLGTASESKFQEVLSHGVKKVYLHTDDYVQDILKAHPEGVDIIVNSNGGPDIEKCFKMLKRCGTLILIGSNCTAIYPNATIWGVRKPAWDPQTVSSALLISKNYTVAGVNIGLLLETHPEMMQAMVAKIFQLRSSGKIEPRIHSVLPFEEVADGMKQLCERRNYGKIILEVKQKDATPEEPEESDTDAAETQPLLAREEPSQAVAEATDGDKQEPKPEPTPAAAVKVEPVVAEKESAAEVSETKEAAEKQPKQSEETSTTEVPKGSSEPQ